MTQSIFWKIAGLNVNLTVKAISVPLRNWDYERLTHSWVTENETSLCQTLQTCTRTVVMHIAGNGLKCINMCILKCAPHYPWEWVCTHWGDVIAHATCSLGLRSLAGADERWLQLMWILCTINICSLASLKKRKGKKKSQTQLIDVLLTYTMASVQCSHTMLRITECYLIIKKKACSILRVHLEAFILL